jgi:hypothetical protein
LLTQPPNAWHAAGPLRRVGDAAHDLFPNLLDVLRAAFARTRRGKNSVDEFAASRGKEPPFNAVEAEMAFRHSLETFIAVARIWGMTPLLMTQASRFAAKPDPDLLAQWNPAVQGVTFDEVRARFGHFNDVIRRVAQEQRVPLIDLDRIIAPSRLDMYDIVHYTDAGSERVAGIITKNLIALERAEPAPVP